MAKGRGKGLGATLCSVYNNNHQEILPGMNVNLLSNAIFFFPIKANTRLKQAY